MKIFIRAIVVFTGCVLSVWAYALTDPTGLLAALKQGDVAKVEQIMRAQSADPQMIQIARTQLAHNLPRLLQLAKKCERAAIRDPQSLTEALYCNDVAIGAASSIGDAHEFISEALWRRVRLIPVLKKQLHLTLASHSGSFTSLKVGDLQKAAARIRALSVDWQAESGSVAVDHANAFTVTEPKIRISINGHTVDAMVDTRWNAPAPLIVIEPQSSTALNGSELGLTPLLTVVPPPRSAAATSSSTTTSTTWKLAHTVSVGPVTLHHLFVVEAYSGRAPPGVYITMSLLTRFGEVVVGRDSVSFARHSKDACRSRVGMVFAGDENQTGWLIFPVFLDGHEKMATLFTDSSVPLRGDRKALAGGGWPDNGSDTEGGHVRQGPLPVVLGDQTYKAKYAIANLGGEAPYQLEIGNPILESHSVHLVFDGPQPTICLSENQ